jgi:hypothetical protein
VQCAAVRACFDCTGLAAQRIQLRPNIIVGPCQKAVRRDLSHVHTLASTLGHSEDLRCVTKVASCNLLHTYFLASEFETKLQVLATKTLGSLLLIEWKTESRLLTHYISVSH